MLGGQCGRTQTQLQPYHDNMAPTHLIADMRAYLPEREYLQCMEQGEAANTQRLYAILAERGRLGEVGWGWIRVNDRKIQCWMIQTEVNDDVRVTVILLSRQC